MSETLTSATLPISGDGQPHQCFTVNGTAYLRNLDAEALQERCIAIHHQAAPTINEDGSRRLALRFPMLIVTDYLNKPRAIADRIAAILNSNWDKFGKPDPRDAVVDAAQAVLARYQSEQFIRTADAHSPGCQCKRCEFDALEAALGAVTG